jgi:hypothetical protein
MRTGEQCHPAVLAGERRRPGNGGGGVRLDLGGDPGAGDEAG